jgi:hypothetical protein
MTKGSQNKNNVGDVQNFGQQETGSDVDCPGATTLGGRQQNSECVSRLEVWKLMRCCYGAVRIRGVSLITGLRDHYETNR